MMTPNKKILVVEDDSSSLYFMELLISECGYAFTGASTGEQALAAVRKEKFDLILMDLRLPGISGYDVTDIIRKDIDKAVPVFAVTAHSAQAASLKCYDIGMNEFISKPVDANHLKELIFKYLDPK